MDLFLLGDAVATFYLQDWFYRLPNTEVIAAAVTQLGDPRYSYNIIFPVVFYLLGPMAGYHVILAASMAEWCNIVLKWLLLGNRPYWWVQQHTNWPHLLHQSHVTCETGPGNPSGHVMITLVVLLIAVSHIRLRRKKRVLLVLVWLTVVAIGTSRVLISSHFIHQIICGLIFGVFIHYIISIIIIPTLMSSFLLIITAAPVMIGLALSIFHIWTCIGMDPGFSIPLAQKYCVNSDWVHINTTPLFSLMRSAGSVVGVAFISTLCHVHQPNNKYSLPLLLISVLLIGCLEMVPMATDVILFYVQSLVKCSLVPVTVGSIHFLFHNILL